jgi:hypothetical protein
MGAHIMRGVMSALIPLISAVAVRQVTPTHEQIQDRDCRIAQGIRWIIMVPGDPPHPPRVM